MQFRDACLILAFCIFSGCSSENDSIPLFGEGMDSEPSCSERILTFSGYEWNVKCSGSGFDGPGPNRFSDTSKNVWVDDEGLLHLKITKRNGVWYCAEVILAESFGYGRYVFFLSSRIDQLDENVVLGFFTWDNESDDAPAQNFREIDIEFSRWGVTHNDNSQYVVQPWDTSGNRLRFNTVLSVVNSTHFFDWKSSGINFYSMHGSSPEPPGEGPISSWSYTNTENIPTPGKENARINLWLYGGKPPSDGIEAEVVIERFEFGQ